MINIFKEFFKKNIYYIIGILLLILLSFSGYEFYEYLHKEEIKKTSKLYFNAIKNINNEELNSIEILEKISQTKTGFSLLSSMDLAKVYIQNEQFENAYNLYNKLINDDNIDDLYKDLIIVQASYNLMNKVDSEKISLFLSKVNIEESVFKSHFYEIKYINLLDQLDKKELERLSKKIENDVEITISVKERVKKLNDYIQNK